MLLRPSHVQSVMVHHPVRLRCRFMAFDKHLNLVLGDSEELRKLPPKKNQDEVRTAARFDSMCHAMHSV